uniref:Uncharacterized protein n=1 Tax=Strigamia maritima TaxID=126957 RepID=T1IJF0_STRMM
MSDLYVLSLCSNFPLPQDILSPLDKCLPLENGLASVDYLSLLANEVDVLSMLSVNESSGELLREVEEGNVSPPFKSRQSRSPLRAHRRLNTTPRKPTPPDSNKDTKLAGGIKSRNRYRSRSLSASSTDSYSSGF